MKHGSLFSGIGGFDLAAEWIGWENVFHCEINEFCNKVLNHYWPNATGYKDITKTDFSQWRGKVDIVSGGFPCQPYSTAGKRKGKEDHRHLWPEMLRAIREIRPRWVVGENVPGLINWSRGMVLKEIKADLEAEGFEIVSTNIIPACSKNANHQRSRLWIIAYSMRNGFQRRQETHNGKAGKKSVDKQITRCDKFYSEEWENESTESPICSTHDGLSRTMDGITFSNWRSESIKGYGNAVVPQVVYEIFKAIESCN